MATFSHALCLKPSIASPNKPAVTRPLLIREPFVAPPPRLSPTSPLSPRRPESLAGKDDEPSAKVLAWVRVRDDNLKFANLRARRRPTAAHP